MRLALLGLVHEANTFAPEVVDALTLERATRRGPGVISEHQGAQTSAAGFLRLADASVEVVPLVVAYPNPSGVIEQAAMDGLVGEMQQALRAAGPLDGVLMPLHGAGVAQHDDDIETTLLLAVREVVGDTMPIAVTFDMHGNIAPRTGELAQVVTAYQTNPHVDSADRAEVAGRILVDAIASGRPTTTIVTPIPACVTILRQGTDTEPMASLLQQARAIGARHGCLDVSLMQGFPYADVPMMGMSVIAVATEASAAEGAATEIAALVWERRQQLDDHCATISEAVEQVCSAGDDCPGPILLLDVGDNIGGGAPGDSVELLRVLLAAGIGGVLALVNDPPAVEACWAAGLGTTISVTVGGASPASPSDPLLVTGQVWSLREGPWVDRGTTHMGQSWFDAGRCAVIRLDDGGSVLLTSRLQIPSGLAQARSLGVDPAEARVIIGKGVNSPLAGYGPISSRTIQVDTPGITRASFEFLGHRKRPRPLFPFER